jgi:hypothetical protein
VSDEGFYDPELHSIDEDERVLHVPVCSVGAVKTVWSDLLGAGAGDWNASALKTHVVALMEKNLGKDRAHRRAFAKEADLPAWFETDILIGFILFPRHFVCFILFPRHFVCFILFPRHFRFVPTYSPTIIICFILFPRHFHFVPTHAFSGTQIKRCSLARCTLGAIFLTMSNWWHETRSWIGSTVCCGKFQSHGRSLGGE